MGQPLSPCSNCKYKFAGYNHSILVYTIASGSSAYRFRHKGFHPAIKHVEEHVALAHQRRSCSPCLPSVGHVSARLCRHLQSGDTPSLENTAVVSPWDDGIVFDETVTRSVSICESYMGTSTKRRRRMPHPSGKRLALAHKYDILLPKHHVDGLEGDQNKVPGGMQVRVPRTTWATVPT